MEKYKGVIVQIYDEHIAFVTNIRHVPTAMVEVEWENGAVSEVDAKYIKVLEDHNSADAVRSYNIAINPLQPSEPFKRKVQLHNTDQWGRVMGMVRDGVNTNSQLDFIRSVYSIMIDGGSYNAMWNDVKYTDITADEFVNKLVSGRYTNIRR